MSSVSGVPHGNQIDTNLPTAGGQAERSNTNTPRSQRLPSHPLSDVAEPALKRYKSDSMLGLRLSANLDAGAGRAQQATLQQPTSAALLAAAHIGRAGLGNVSTPMEMKDVPPLLRQALIKEMAVHFSALWGKEDPGLKTPAIAIDTLSEMTHHPSTVFQVQFDRHGKLVSTSTIVDRDEPPFDKTGPGGIDLYGPHWVANVFTSPDFRGNGYATAQIKALQGVATARGWPQVWLYCRDEQDGVALPKYYSEKLDFEHFNDEWVDEHGNCLGVDGPSYQGKKEKENIMVFNTGVDHNTPLLRA